jgi:hypothetical protein
MGEDGPGWEQQEAYERERWDEEQELERIRLLTEALREETIAFEQANKEFWDNWRTMYAEGIATEGSVRAVHQADERSRMPTVAKRTG